MEYSLSKKGRLQVHTVGKSLSKSHFTILCAKRALSNLTTSLCPCLQVNTNIVHPFMSLGFKSIFAGFCLINAIIFVNFLPLCSASVNEWWTFDAWQKNLDQRVCASRWWSSMIFKVFSPSNVHFCVIVGGTESTIQLSLNCLSPWGLRFQALRFS